MATPRAWYSYDGTGLKDQPSSYFFSSVAPNCTSGNNLCAVYAYYGGDYPAAITAHLITYIGNGLSSHLPEPTDVGAKKYVYLKN